MESLRSFDRTIQSGDLGSVNTCSKRGSSIASPLFRGRKPGARGKVPHFGELQLGVDHGSISNCCSVAPSVHAVLSTIAEETVPIPSTSSSPAEPVPSPVSPVLSLQKRTHIHSIGRGGSAPPLPIGSEKQYFVPVWQVSHPEHVDLSDSKIVVTVFLSESQHFRGREMKIKPSRQTTHVRVHAGPHARRTYPGIALIDAGSPQSFVLVRFLRKWLQLVPPPCLVCNTYLNAIAQDLMVPL